MPNSIHTARWLSQISDQGWDLYLYPSIKTNKIHSLIKNTIICIPFLLKERSSIIYRIIIRVYNEIIKRKNISYYEKRLYKYIKKIKPDIIHTLETQAAGYMVAYIKKKYFKNKIFPIWVHSVWGSDIYLFGKLDEHKHKINEVFRNCDFLFSESKRDIKLAKKYGFKGINLPIIQAAGGFDINSITDYKKTLTSTRNKIILKGYQGWAGRALVGLHALELCAEQIRKYKIIIYLPNTEVELAAKLLTAKTGIFIEIVPNGTPHDKILKYYNQSKIFIGLSISDGVPNTLLEAMAMGSFPIQSWTSAADEWLIDGESGILVPPEDPDIIAKAIIKALLDNKLLDHAAEINWNTVKSRLDINDLKQKTIESYNKIVTKTE